MVQLRGGRIASGTLLGSAGAASLASGLQGAAFLPATFLAMPGPLAAAVTGGALLAAGSLLLVTSWRTEEVEEEVVPAQVAFSSRPSAAPQEIADVMAHQAPRRQKPPAGPVGAADEEIREITREINKAGVMLATGKLSGEGYAKYVDGLKRKRGELEAKRLQRELGGKS